MTYPMVDAAVDQAVDAATAPLLKQIADLKAQVVALTPPPKQATLGLAVPGGDIAGFHAATAAGLDVKWARLYNTTIPTSLATWADADDAHAAGLKLWLSIAVSPTNLAAGTYDAKLAAFCSSLPPGTRVTTNHEPSNKSKGITPAAYQAAWNHAAAVIAANGCQPWAIEIQANVVKGGYLWGLDPALLAKGGIGLDGYAGVDGNPDDRTAEQVFTASVAAIRAKFPTVALGVAEFNSSRATGWSQWVAESLTWFRGVGINEAVLFTSLDTWRRSPDQLTDLAHTLTV